MTQSLAKSVLFTLITLGLKFQQANYKWTENSSLLQEPKPH